MFEIRTFPLLKSTNDTAFEFIDTNRAKHGLVIQAKEQTKGRGQGKNRWLSTPNENGTFSILLNCPFLEVKNFFLLNVLVSLSLKAFLSKKTKKEVAIKWPNDILVGGKKICGILIENRMRGNFFQWSVIGIGINVNQTLFETFDREATSLKIITKREYNILEIISSYLDEFKEYLEKIEDETFFEKLKEEYETSLYLLDEVSSFEKEGSVFQGKIIGIDVSGKLLIQSEDTLMSSYLPNEISYCI